MVYTKLDPTSYTVFAFLISDIDNEVLATYRFNIDECVDEFLKLSKSHNIIIEGEKTYATAFVQEINEKAGKEVAFYRQGDKG